MVFNPYIVVPIATWAVAQLSKFAWAALRGRVDFRYLYASGGMPSVHSAVVVAMATTALLVDGASSHLFGLTLFIALIVMYDSFGVRRSAGEQAVALNALYDSLADSRIRLERPALRVREILGHQPEEVTMGALLGFVLGAVFNYDKMGVVSDFIQVVPSGPELVAYGALAAVLIIGSAVTRWLLGRRRSSALRQVARQLLSWGQTVGWLVAVVVVLSYERARYFGWRLWIMVILAIGVVWLVGLAVRWRRRLPEALATEATVARKRKWLSLPRRKRRS